MMYSSHLQKNKKRINSLVYSNTYEMKLLSKSKLFCSIVSFLVLNSLHYIINSCFVDVFLNCITYIYK